MRQCRQRKDRRRNAAGREPADHAPVDAAGKAMHEAAAGLGGRGIKQVGSDRGRGMHAEQHDQDRRHQRAAADAGHANQEADGEARQRVQRINHRNDLVATGLQPTI